MRVAIVDDDVVDVVDGDNQNLEKDSEVGGGVAGWREERGR